MLLKLYDMGHTPLGILNNCKDVKVESELSTGDKTLSFLWYGRTGIQIKNEYYIRTETDEYVVKENAKAQNGFRSITARLNLEEIEAKTWKTFTASDSTAKEMADLALADTGWTCISSVPVGKRRNIAMVRVNAYQVLERITEAFICEIQWDTIGKKVYLKEQVGGDKGAYFISGLNLKEVSDTFDSYDFATEIIPIGEDGLEITEINGGKNYLSNHQYSAKKITVIWEDGSYTDANALKEDAAYRLGEISKPKKTVQAKVIDLAKMKPGYGVLSYSVGDTVWLIDQETGTREKQRITKTVEYLDAPEKNTCDISNTVLSFEDMQKKLLAAAECVSNITTGNGTVKGESVDKIDISQVVGVDDLLLGDLKDITADYIYVRKELGAVYAAIGVGDFTTVNTNNLTVNTRADISLLYATELHADNTYGDYAKYRVVEADNISALAAKIDELQASNITVEYLQANYAQIDLANVKTQSVANLFVEVGLLESATIVNGHITGYLDSVSINANTIKAGTLSVDRLVLNGTEESLIFALNNIGELTSTHCDTLDGGLLTKRTVTADHIVAGTITANEIAAGAITADKITANAITANKIAAGAITADKIAARAITADKISVNSLEAIVAKIGGFTIGASYLANNTTTLGTTANSVYLGIDGISCGTAFKVGKTGALNCTSADITGKLTSRTSTDTMVIDAASIVTTNYINGAAYKKTTITSTQVSVGVTSNSGTYLSEMGINIKYNGNSIFSVLDGTMACSQKAYFQGGLDAKTIQENGTALSSKYQAKGSYAAANHTHNYAAANHTHSYLPLSGGTLTGNLVLNNARALQGKNSSGALCQLLILNSGNNFHIGPYAESDQKPAVFLHGEGSQYDFLSGIFRSNKSNAIRLGDSSHLWQAVYAKNGTIQTSDRTKKHNIQDIPDKYIDLFYKLKPKIYMFHDGDRIHVGAISQDVEEALHTLGMSAMEFGGFCKDIRYEYEYNEDGHEIESTKRPATDQEGNVIYDYSMRYQEFTFMHIEATHRLKRENEILKGELDLQKEEIDLLKKSVAFLMEKQGNGNQILQV